MKPCDHLSPYLDGRLERAGRDYFETHLYICSECREVVNAWACAKTGLKNEALERRKRLIPTDDEAAKLVEWAILDQSSRGICSVKTLVPLTALVSFVLAFWLGMSWPNTPESPSYEGALARQSRDVATLEASAFQLSEIPLEYKTNSSGHTTGWLGKDQFGLGPGSQLTVLSASGKDMLLKLEEGTAAFQVSPRKNGRRFIVEAGAYRVMVVGTRFSVDARKEGVRVAVAEGIVEVSEQGGRGWRLVAGEALSAVVGGKAERLENDENETDTMARLLGELPFDEIVEAPMEDVEADESEAVAMQFNVPEETPKSTRLKKRAKRRRFRKTRKGRSSAVEARVGLETGASLSDENSRKNDVFEDGLTLNPSLTLEGVDLWRQWVLDGRFEAAEVALMAHIETHPVDTDAYSLLADCRRKAGKYSEAIEAYKMLTAIAGGYQANRARFKAGVLMQEKMKNHLGAAAIFDEYLATGKGTPLLRAKATVRLAGSLIELGEIERARILLRRIIDGYSGSSVAIEARQILNRID